MASRTALHEWVASSPVAMEAYWLFNPRGRRFDGHYNVERLHAALPPAVAGTRPFAQSAPRGKSIFIFATLHYWIEQAAFMGLALAGAGHRVTLGYLPYASWQKEIPLFDLRRQALRTRDLLKPAAGLVGAINLLDQRPGGELPASLREEIEQVSAYDVMYTRQVEDVDREDPLYRLRLERNGFAARAALAWLNANRPDVVLVPNGTILELGAVFRAARHLGLETITYEFNDQREQIWLAENDEIMRQNTDALWVAFGGTPLAEEQSAAIHAFEAARMGARLEGKAARQWQEVAASGSDRVRAELGLDERPVVLLATNVLGDSLTLGRNIFSQSMAEWIRRTVQYLAARNDVQLVVRIHPGERLTHGPSMVDVVREAVFAEQSHGAPLPGHVHVVGALDKVNTYDLMGLASLGLVFTTTAGLEMALNGLPVITAGQTHYRGRGFTLDPVSWDEYFALLDHALATPTALTPQQVELAWRYAYHFFYSYPRPFPWRLISFSKDLQTWPLKRVLGAEGQAEFGATFTRLAGNSLSVREQHG
jgi:hypothetical protein